MSNNNSWNPEKLDRVVNFVNQGQRTKFAQPVKEDNPRENIINEIIQAINKGEPSTNILEDILREIAEKFKADGVIIYRQNQENIEIYQEWRKFKQVATTLTITQEKANFSSSQITSELDNLLIHCLVNETIFVEGKLFGQLTLLTIKERESISLEEKTTLRSIAGLIGIAIEKIDLAKKIESLSVVNQELLKAKENNDLANKAQEEFFSHMTHDLRSPLAAILGFARMLKDQMF